MSGTGDEGFYDVMVDISGNIIAVGRHSGQYPYIVKFDSGGNVLWQKYYTGVAQNNFYSVYVDSSSNIYTCGGANGMKDHVCKFNSSGNFQWGVSLLS